jgi:hypothetical protein
MANTATKAAISRVRTTKRDYVNELKKKPCMDCGRVYPPYVMEFDHVRGTKDRSISRAVRDLLSWQRLEAEIAKCDLVCANCHRIRTFARRTDFY